MTDSERERLSRHRGRARVFVAVAASGLTILGGVAIGTALRSSAAGGVAAAAVAAAFGGYFAPCSFPILVNVMLVTHRGSAVGYAGKFAVGVAGFYAVAGGIAFAASEALAGFVGAETTGGTILRVSAAAVLAIAGLVQLRFITVRLPSPIRRIPASSPVAHGFVYLLAGFG